MSGGYCITCGKCRAKSDMSAWVDGLPTDYYKCPECGVIIHKVYEGQRAITLHNGEKLFIPGDITIIEADLSELEARSIVHFKKRGGK